MPDSTYTPYVVPITSITNAQYAVIGFGGTHPYSVGEIVSFRVSPPYGMVQINNLQATILAIGADTITVPIDSALFTPFVYPPVGTVAAIAVTVPVGSGVIPGPIPTVNLQDVFDNVPTV